MQLPKRDNYYYDKDAIKAKPCNKYIGRGNESSATGWYQRNLPTDVVNCQSYVESDIVLVSVEGNRPNRVSFDPDEVLLAMSSGCTIVTDNLTSRKRPYNIGERELAQFLKANGYSPTDHPKGAVWTPND